MKEKILNIIWLCLPVLMAGLIIIAYINGQETVNIWDLFIWVLLVFWLQLLIINKQKVITKLRHVVTLDIEMHENYRKMITELESMMKDANSKLQNYIAGEKREIWNIIIQSFDKTGEEEHYSIDSFVTESLARDKYHAWLEEDRSHPDNNVEETPGVLEYWYTRESGEMTRVKVVKSYVFDSLE